MPHGYLVITPPSTWLPIYHPSVQVGDALNHSFDDMMICIQGLPYLEEEVGSKQQVVSSKGLCPTWRRGYAAGAHALAPLDIIPHISPYIPRCRRSSRC